MLQADSSAARRGGDCKGKAPAFEVPLGASVGRWGCRLCVCSACVWCDWPVLMLYGWPDRTNKPSKKSTDEHVVFEWSAASAYGLFLVLLALICDGVYGPMQNKIKQEFGGLTAHHNMLSMNLIQGLFSLLKVGLVDGVPYVAVRGFSEVLSFCQRNPAIVPQIGYMTLTMIAGNLFIYEVRVTACTPRPDMRPKHLPQR